MKKQNFNWLHDFYERFLRADEHKKIVKAKPIFRDENENAVSAFDENGHLILFLPTGEKNYYKTIHPELLSNKNSREFIENFGIKQPSLKDEIYNKILPLYNNNDGIDTEPHFSKFFKYYKDECPQSEINNFLDLLKDKAFVLYKSSIDDIYYRGIANEIYYPTEDLLKYFETKLERKDPKAGDTKFLDLEFYHDLIKEKDKYILEEFLLKIGVAKYPRIILKKRQKSDLDEQQINQLARLNGTPKYQKYFDKIVDGCGEIIIKIVTEKEKSKSILLWKQLLNMIRDSDVFSKELEGKHEWIYYNQKEPQSKNFYSSAFILLTQEKWLVTKKEEFASADEIYIEDLSNDYDTESEYAKRFIYFLKIKKRPLSENDNAAKSLGLENAEELEKLKEESKELRKIKEKYSQEDFYELDKIKAKRTQFPTSNSANPERRAENITNEHVEPKTYETKERNVRVTIPKNTKPYLKDMYTNDDNQLICQICKEEMPFKKRNEEYYFEAIEIFSEAHIIDEERAEVYLALCPECAAKYVSGGFIDEAQKHEIKEKILNEKEPNENGNYDIPISLLLDYKTTIRFVAKHFGDLKAILKPSSPPNKPEIGEKRHKCD